RRQRGMAFQQRLLQGRARGGFFGGRQILALHPRPAVYDQYRLGGGGGQRERQAQRQHHHSRTRHGQALSRDEAASWHARRATHARGRDLTTRATASTHGVDL